MAYASGKRAYGISDRSGRRYRLRDMRKEWTGSLVGPDEFEAKHPQLLPLKPFPDPQALRNPRPDQVESKSKVLLEFNPFFVSVVDSNQLTVYEPGHGKTTGDRVRFTNAQSFQDFYAKTLNRSEGYIITVISVDEYTITVEAPTEPTLNQSTAQYDNMVSVGILAASVQVNTDNQMVLFNNNQAINGRPLGDVTGNNDLSVTDSLAYLKWNNGINEVTEQVNYIQNTMNPYMFSNFNAYKKFLQKSTIPNSRGGGGLVTVEELAEASPTDITITGVSSVTSSGTVTVNVTNVTTYTVTVQNVNGNNKYFIDGVQQPTLNLSEGNTYIFNWSAATTHPVRFSTTSDGTHGGGTEYTTGVVKDDLGYKTTITVAVGAPTLYYYCQNHPNMGGQINTP